MCLSEEWDVLPGQTNHCSHGRHNPKLFANKKYPVPIYKTLQYMSKNEAYFFYLNPPQFTNCMVVHFHCLPKIITKCAQRWLGPRLVFFSDYLQ